MKSTASYAPYEPATYEVEVYLIMLPSCGACQAYAMVGSSHPVVEQLILLN